MALTNDLIQQFVKATKDNSGKTSETVAYGTIVKSNDKTYVQLDGSTLYTPVSSTIVVKHGDRVMVTSKNHSLVVTGNLTDPSASSGDVDDVKENVNTRIDEFDIVLLTAKFAVRCRIQFFVVNFQFGKLHDRFFLN